MLPNRTPVPCRYPTHTAKRSKIGPCFFYLVLNTENWHKRRLDSSSKNNIACELYQNTVIKCAGWLLIKYIRYFRTCRTGYLNNNKPHSIVNYPHNKWNLDCSHKTAGRLQTLSSSDVPSGRRPPALSSRCLCFTSFSPLNNCGQVSLLG